MVKLKPTFNRNGYCHKIVWRDENYAITELSDIDSDKFVCYEAYRVQVKKSGHPNSTAEYPRETTPRDEDWGKKGYSVWDLQTAHDKINLLRKKYGNKKHKR